MVTEEVNENEVDDKNEETFGGAADGNDLNRTFEVLYLCGKIYQMLAFLCS